MTNATVAKNFLKDLARCASSAPPATVQRVKEHAASLHKLYVGLRRADVAARQAVGTVEKAIEEDNEQALEAALQNLVGAVNSRRAAREQITRHQDGGIEGLSDLAELGNAVMQAGDVLVGVGENLAEMPPMVVERLTRSGLFRG